MPDDAARVPRTAEVFAASIFARVVLTLEYVGLECPVLSDLETMDESSQENNTETLM